MNACSGFTTHPLASVLAAGAARCASGTEPKRRSASSRPGGGARHPARSRPQLKTWGTSSVKYTGTGISSAPRSGPSRPGTSTKKSSTTLSPPSWTSM